MLAVSLLIAETGARWVGRALAWRTPANQVLALIQNHEESHCEFRSRVEQRLERLRMREVWPEQILLLDRPADDGRPESRQMLQWIVGKLSGSPRPARVLLVPGAPARVLELPWESLLHADAIPTQGAPSPASFCAKSADG
jgi:hypothetical protein